VTGQMIGEPGETVKSERLILAESLSELSSANNRLASAAVVSAKASEDAAVRTEAAAYESRKAADATNRTRLWAKIAAGLGALVVVLLVAIVVAGIYAAGRLNDTAQAAKDQGVRNHEALTRLGAIQDFLVQCATPGPATPTAKDPAHVCYDTGSARTGQAIDRLNADAAAREQALANQIKAAVDADTRNLLHAINAHQATVPTLAPIVIPAPVAPPPTTTVPSRPRANVTSTTVCPVPPAQRILGLCI
jgi:hypothetical protein